MTLHNFVLLNSNPLLQNISVTHNYCCFAGKSINGMKIELRLRNIFIYTNIVAYCTSITQEEEGGGGWVVHGAGSEGSANWNS